MTEDMWFASLVCPLALGLGGVLAAFALLASVGSVCVGCLVYGYVMVPLVRRRRST